MRLGLVGAFIVAVAVPAAAQERPFLFSIATATDAKPAARFDYDIGVGEHAFQSDTANQPEQRIGLQASRGRLTFLARVGISEVGSSYQSSQSGEALYSILRPTGHVALAAGGGVLHEAGGVNVLLARVVAGRNTDAWRLDGNLQLQKPMSSERDALDLITSVGWARKLPHGVSLGVEAIGEDLEGFWESEESGGRRPTPGRSQPPHLARRTTVAVDRHRRPDVPPIPHGTRERGVPRSSAGDQPHELRGQSGAINRARLGSLKRGGRLFSALPLCCAPAMRATESVHGGPTRARGRSACPSATATATRSAA